MRFYYKISFFFNSSLAVASTTIYNFFACVNTTLMLHVYARLSTDSFQHRPKLGLVPKSLFSVTQKNGSYQKVQTLFHRQKRIHRLLIDPACLCALFWLSSYVAGHCLAVAPQSSAKQIFLSYCLHHKL